MPMSRLMVDDLPVMAVVVVLDVVVKLRLKNDELAAAAAAADLFEFQASLVLSSMQHRNRDGSKHSQTERLASTGLLQRQVWTMLTTVDQVRESCYFITFFSIVKKHCKIIL